MSTISNTFYSYYNNDIKSLNENQVCDLVLKNLKEIVSLNDKNNQGTLAFNDSDGTIVLDKTWYKSAASFVKSNIINPTSYNEDIKNLTIFSKFVSKFVKNSHLDEQHLLAIQSMIQKSVEVLRAQRPQMKALTDSANKLEKASKHIATQIETMHKPIEEQIKQEINYLRLDKKLLPEEKIQRLHAKFQELANPMFGKEAMDKAKKEEMDLLRKLQEEEAKASPDQKKVSSLKAELKRYQGLGELYQAIDTQKILNEEAFRPYKEFVDDLKKTYSNEADREFLLMALLLSQPKEDELSLLKKELSNLRDQVTSKDLKTLQRQMLEESPFLVGAFRLIEARKLAKKAAEIPLPPEDSRPYQVMRAIGQFSAVGGITALSFAVPKAAFALFFIPNLVKSATDNLKQAWNGRTQQEKDIILTEMKDWVKEVQKNPTKALETVQKYHERSKQGQQIVKITKLIVKAIQAHNVDDILRSISEGKIPEES